MPVWTPQHTVMMPFLVVVIGAMRISELTFMMAEKSPQGDQDVTPTLLFMS